MEDNKSSAREETQDVKQSEVKELFKAGIGPADLAGNGFTYRHDWGSRHGLQTLHLNWGAISCNSRVFVSASEFSGGAQCDFIGVANYVVYNVAPHAGQVSIRLFIDWDSDIRVHVDYLVVNP